MDIPIAYVAGFFDGDGCVCVDKQKGGYTIHVNITQCDYNILLQFQQQFGGRLHKRQPNEETKRTQYQLILSGWDAYNVLVKMRPHLRVKAYVTDLTIKFMNEHYRGPECVEKKELANAISTENQAPTRTPMPRAPITIEYISGIFDAEGCCRVDYLSITQKSDITILYEVAEYFGYGTVDGNYWKWTVWAMADRRSILNDMVPFLTVKKEQARLTMLYIDGRKELEAEITKLKHVNFDLPITEIERLNALQIDSRTSAVRNDIHNELRYEANKRSADRQSTLGSVNKGPRTATMINNAITTQYKYGTTRRKITDNQIIEVQRRLTEKESGNSIAKSMGLHSAQIYNIRDGLLLPLSVLKASDNPVELNKKARNDFLRQEDELTIAIKKASRILGGNNNRALDDETMLKIRQELKDGKMSKKIAETYNINPSIVAKVKAGKLKTAAEVRDEARNDGVYVDAVRLIQGETTTEYPDVWAAASATGNKPWQILTWLDDGRPVNGLIWQKKW